MKFIILVSNLIFLLHPVKHSSMFTRIFMILFIYSVTYTANLFGKAFVNVRNCLRKEKHLAQTKNIDGFLGRYNIFFLHKACYILPFVSFSCRIRQYFLFVPCAFPSANNFAHSQTLYRIGSLLRSRNI
jgi:hypothetical protein